MTAVSEAGLSCCWSCGSHNLTAGGFDGEGNPITVCAGCGTRQEEE